MKRNFTTRIALGAVAILASTGAYAAEPYRIAVSNSYIGNEWRVEMINFMQAYTEKALKGKATLTVNNLFNATRNMVGKLIQPVVEAFWKLDQTDRVISFGILRQ